MIYLFIDVFILQALAEKRGGIFDCSPFFTFLNGLLNRRRTSRGELRGFYSIFVVARFVAFVNVIELL